MAGRVRSTLQRPTYICIGRYGVMGRVTLQTNNAWWFDCCAVGGYKQKSASGYTQLLEDAKHIVEFLVKDDAVNMDEVVERVGKALDRD
jgi:hypothetical protein